ncbi:Transmembrane domain of unknown function (DUF3566) [Actinoalloteichus sp. GBA129-24]|nr:Transmembrane domain of unknown function (DUF3566) [Actinoalloteichus sp. GBA129-24]
MSSPGNSDSASGTDQQAPDSEKTSFMTTLDAKNAGDDKGAKAVAEKPIAEKPIAGKTIAGKTGDQKTGDEKASPAASPVSTASAEGTTPAPRAAGTVGSGTGSPAGKDSSSATKSESRPESPRADTPAATPPWQRTTVAGQPSAQSSTQSPDAMKSSGYASSGAPAGPSTGAGGGEATTMTQPVGSGQQPGAGRGAVTFPAGNVRTPGQPPGAAPGVQPPQARPAGSAPSGGGRRPGRGPRRASLQIKRIDPWSVLKLTLVLSMAMFVVWLIAVGVLYGVLDGMQVWDQLNGTYNDLAGESADSALISAGRVFGVAAIIGAVNIVLFTALATVGAFVYNVSADLAGGIEVTLSERD